MSQECKNEDYFYFQFAIAFWVDGSLQVRVITLERPTSRLAGDVIESVSLASIGRLIVMQGKLLGSGAVSSCLPRKVHTLLSLAQQIFTINN